jgi:hypothetical protein
MPWSTSGPREAGRRRNCQVERGRECVCESASPGARVSRPNAPPLTPSSPEEEHPEPRAPPEPTEQEVPTPCILASRVRISLPPQSRPKVCLPSHDPLGRDWASPPSAPPPPPPSSPEEEYPEPRASPEPTEQEVPTPCILCLFVPLATTHLQGCLAHQKHLPSLAAQRSPSSSPGGGISGTPGVSGTHGSASHRARGAHAYLTQCIY